MDLLCLIEIRQVWKAKDTETNEIVALKKVRMDNEREGVRDQSDDAENRMLSPVSQGTLATDA